MNAVQSKADRDRLRGRAAGNRATIDAIRNILRDYRQGRAASACMAEIERLLVKPKVDKSTPAAVPHNADTEAS